MKLYPESAYIQLEFDKIRTLVLQRCETDYGRQKAEQLRIHTHKKFIDAALKESHEFKQLIQNGVYFPNDYILNLAKELKLLSIPGALLTGEQLIQIRKLAESIEKIFRWFDAERKGAYEGLYSVIKETYYEKAIIGLIDEVIDEIGQVKDSASPELKEIRMELYRKRNELRRVFDRIVSKLNKQGYLAEIEESFMNGRRVIAVFAEQKRTVKGILHRESDSRKTAFIEPEETIHLNNEVSDLEHEEHREIDRILRQLTARLASYSALLVTYHAIVGEYDFIRAKAKFAIEINGEAPIVQDKAQVHLVNAVHPLLYLYNKKHKNKRFLFP